MKQTTKLQTLKDTLLHHVHKNLYMMNEPKNFRKIVRQTVDIEKIAICVNFDSTPERDAIYRFDKEKNEFTYLWIKQCNMYGVATFPDAMNFEDFISFIKDKEFHHVTGVTNLEKNNGLFRLVDIY